MAIRDQSQPKEIVPLGRSWVLAKQIVVEQRTERGSEIAPHVAPTEDRTDIFPAGILSICPERRLAEIDRKVN